MDLGFIINSLQKTKAASTEERIAKGEWKIISSWAEAKEQILWQLKRK